MSRRRRQLGSAEACPRYVIKLEPFDGGIEAQAYVGHERVGNVIASVVEIYGRDSAFRVQHSAVAAEHRRCGLGTKLYTKVAQWGCAKGQPLESDSHRSEHSQGFWAKQETKKRARCMTKARREPDPRAKGIQEGRGGCETYRLTCPVTDLSGRRKRR